MKAHTNGFKTAIKEFGRELDSIITYEIDGETIELGNEQLNSISPHYEGAILKSVMRQLDIDSNVDIPLNTILNYQFGVKVNGEYEYLDFGNYIVYSSEKQEDTGSYKIVCYDKMLYSMVNYEDMELTYPITIRDYITAICNKLGLTFANSGSTFANWNRQIQSEIYLDSDGNSIGYKFRDVLDELAQVTASTICINANDQLEIRYINDTNDTIDEEYLKDINVSFGQYYGPINSIVLSRSAEADNVYLQDAQSIEDNGLTELKIIDNHIMNYNDRSEYLPDILAMLDGLGYYINDFSSTGIAYYDLCDMYNISIDDNTYQCVMLNDELNVTQGLEELVRTEMPQETQTDYSKADKTDMRINQTYLIVDKQNQTISSVISNVSEQNNKISQITQTVDDLNSKIQDIADITISGESNFGTFDLNNINESEPIMIKVKPINALNNISYLYPISNLYPSSSLFMTNRKLRFTNNTTSEIIDYELPDNLLYYDATHYDEFYLDYDSQTCQITKRCEYNSDGTISALANERVDTYTYPTIQLTDGDYTITLLGYTNAYLFTRLMAKNIYTSQFATRVEVTSAINQTASEINLEVAKKTNKDEIISTINLSPEEATINANKISLTGKTINLTSDNIAISSSNFNVTSAGVLSCTGANIAEGTVQITDRNGNIVNIGAGYYGVQVRNNSQKLYLQPETMVFEDDYYGFKTYYASTGLDIKEGNTNRADFGVIHGQDGYSGSASLYSTSGTETIWLNGRTGNVRCVSVTQTSREEAKKNFTKLENALDIISNIDIYKYNMQEEDDKDKKHIGFVIGKNYKYSKEITSPENDGVDIYSFVSVCCKAIQEQQEKIRELENKISQLERNDK